MTLVYYYNNYIYLNSIHNVEELSMCSPAAANRRCSLNNYICRVWQSRRKTHLSNPKKMKTAIWILFIIVAEAENQKQISKRCLSYTQNDARTRATTVIFRQLTAPYESALLWVVSIIERLLKMRINLLIKNYREPKQLLQTIRVYYRLIIRPCVFAVV